ncbi:hypothetical protein SDC9_161338 [bioreactor metagenome]|uniref:Uncharacterized protein n=1 Tax=bioreactor metagenome TaxID=1076179 RepID=A0A645FKC5_9ZZZZ
MAFNRVRDRWGIEALRTGGGSDVTAQTVGGIARAQEKMARRVKEIPNTIPVRIRIGIVSRTVPGFHGDGGEPCYEVFRKDNVGT